MTRYFSKVPTDTEEMTWTVNGSVSVDELVGCLRELCVEYGPVKSDPRYETLHKFKLTIVQSIVEILLKEEIPTEDLPAWLEARSAP